MEAQGRFTINNEIKAWVEVCDDPGALRILAHAVNMRLQELAGVQGDGGPVPVGAAAGAQSAAGGPAGNGLTQFPIRRSEPHHAGINSYPMIGPSPAPFYTDAVRAEANAQAAAELRANMAQGGTDQRARAAALAKENPEGSEDKSGEKAQESLARAAQAEREHAAAAAAAAQSRDDDEDKDKKTQPAAARRRGQ